MRITYISSSVIPSTTANSVQVMKMCSAFKGQGHEVCLMCVKGDDQNGDVGQYGVQNEFSMIRLPLNRFPRLQSLLFPVITNWKLLRGPRPDVVYSRDSTCLYLPALLGLPTVYEAHVHLPGKLNYLGKSWLFGRRNFLRMVAISKALADDYLETFRKLPEEKVIVAHDGADVLTAEELEKKSGTIPANRLQVGYSGHLYKGRGIELIHQLARELPDVDFHLAGGTEKDLNYWREQTKSLANFTLHGHMPHNRLHEFLLSMDVVLAPYSLFVTTAGQTSWSIARWMSPMKIFEYMAAKKAIIASDLPVLREVFSHEKTALLCPPGDIASWKQAITTLENDPILRNRISERAYSDFLEKYTWDSRAKAVLDGLIV